MRKLTTRTLLMLALSLPGAGWAAEEALEAPELEEQILIIEDETAPLSDPGLQVRIDDWIAERVMDVDVAFGFHATETRGQAGYAWQSGEPAHGFVLQEGDLALYGGHGFLTEIGLRQPGESESAAWIRLRQYGLGDFTGSWGTREYHSFPQRQDSRWTVSDYVLRYTAAAQYDVIASRTHQAHHGLRSLGQLNSETETFNLCIPLRFDEGRIQGTLHLQDTAFNDESGRIGDVATQRASGAVHAQVGDSQFLSGAVAHAESSVPGASSDQTVRHYTLAYTDAALFGENAWRWELRSDWQQTSSSLQRTVLAERDWSVGSTLTWTARPWRIRLGWETAEHDRFRLSPEAIQELLLDPEREAFDRGIYLKDAPESERWDLSVRYQPDRRWLATVRYRQREATGLPGTSLDIAEDGAFGAALWVAEQEWWDGTVRYQIAPFRSLIGRAWQRERRLPQRGTRTTFEAWNLTYMDASHSTTWYVRVGEYGNSANAPRIDAFANRALIYGAGASLPFGPDDRWRLTADAALAAGTGRDAYDEYSGSLALEYQLAEELSLAGTWTVYALDLADLSDHADSVSHQLALVMRLKY